jgi:Asp-tRNA(Asn)/Glu-tRNA(Gln) amidotransferase C subunit
MTTLTRAALDRVARLARLELSEAEAARLAPALEAITRDFGSLDAYAATLPSPDEPAAGAARADEVAPAPRDVVEGILAAAGPERVDPATQGFVVPRERR